MNLSLFTRTLLLLIFPAICYANDLQFRFIGNQAFEITDGATTLLTDFPYRSGYSGYMEYDFAAVQPKGEALCLITHGHADHFELSLFEKTNCSAFAPPDVASKIDPSRLVVATAPRTRFNDMEIEPLKTPHAKVDHYSYLVTWKGKRFYFTGDTETTDSLLSANNLDVAFVTPWLLGTVQKSGRTIDARRIVIYHHAPGEKIDLCTNCKILQQGQNVRLSDLLKP